MSLLYIEEVINSCDALYPNPYTEAEKYFWCDELSFLLAVKFNIQYEKTELIEENGKFILPEGVTSSLLETLICGNVEIKKPDFYKWGIICRDVGGRCEIELAQNKSFKRIYAVYIIPYEKIRNIVFEGEAEFGENTFKIAKSLFRPGDELEITVNDTVYKNIFVIENEQSDGESLVLIKGGLIPDGICNCKICRKITEQTMCQPPFDSMYIDYVLGKICYYQNDFAACNNHMSMFNSKLADYSMWLKSHPVAGYKKTKLENWW